MITKIVLSLKELFLKRLPLLTQRFQLPEKWKGGRVEKWSLFWQGMYLDYKSVATEVIQESKSRPQKAIMIASGLGLLATAFKTNPDEQSFYEHLLQSISNLSMVSDPIRNPASEEHVTYLTRCENRGLLRQTDLMFFTLLWVADYHKDCNIYAAQCKYLTPNFLTFHQRIVDVGLFGTWLNMKLKMRNFDINPNEWSDST